MEQFVIEARKRDKFGTGAARAYRREGLIPGVVYGQGRPTTAILMDAKRIVTLLRHPGNLINLTIEGEAVDPGLAALLKDTERTPVDHDVLSVDLQWVSMTEAVEVNAPVVFTGAAVGVTRDGGALDQVMHEIAISCLPGDIPQSIVVDISELAVGHSLHVRDITAPAGITLVSSEDDVVVTITRPISAADLEAHLDEAAPVEVVGEEKEEGEG